MGELSGQNNASQSGNLRDFLRGRVRTVPDYPKPGIEFRDLTPVLQDALGLRRVVDELVQRALGHRRGAPVGAGGGSVDVVAGIDARGFILGGAVAHQLGLGFVPVRKPGKLPCAVYEAHYSMEYGQAALQVHQDAFEPGQRVLLVDDLLATGGTAKAAIDLVQRAGARVVMASFVIDLPDLGGSQKLRDLGIETQALIEYGGH